MALEMKHLRKWVVVLLLPILLIVYAAPYLYYREITVGTPREEPIYTYHQGATRSTSEGHCMIALGSKYCEFLNRLYEPARIADGYLTAHFIRFYPIEM